ncbi:MAG: DUF2076 domain-containing protein [Acidobacteriaceae bacterium]|nr:DUF2076 domain-containing protein [Acidobacteriaceae bacterium]
MTPDERNMLTDLANKFAQTPAPPRDPEAEEFIRTHIGNRPDALYMMTQTVLVQNIALQRAQQQIQDLQRGAPVQPAAAGSFLGGAAAPQGAPRPQYAAPPQYSAPPPQYTAPAAPPSGGGGSSFLRGAAQTAAGVAAGTLAVDAIGSLFHGFGGGGGGMFGGGSDRPVEEIVNNYYDTPQDDLRADDRGNYDDRTDYSDQNVDDNQSYDDGSDVGGGFDDSSGGDFNV